MVEAASPYSARSTAPEVGALIPIGGKATYDNLKLVASKMTDGSGLTIVSVTASEDEYEGKYERNRALFQEAFSELGRVGDIFHLHMGTTFRDGREMLENSSTVFITGGSQERGVNSLRQSGLDDVLRDMHEKGTIVAGTSAGASMLPEYMPSRAKIVEGIGLVDGVVVDQHFDERPWRKQRAEAAAAKGFLVFALKEGSGIIYTQSGVEVFGNGMDLFYPTLEGVGFQEVLSGSVDFDAIKAWEAEARLAVAA
jgi:cyanophycinase